MQQCVELDRRLRRRKMAPRKKTHAQIDNRGGESIDRLILFYPEGFFCIEFACHSSQRLRRVRIDTPVACFVGVGQCSLGHSTAKPHLIKKPWQRLQGSDYIEKTVPISQLCKDHVQALIVATEFTISFTPAVALDTTLNSLPVSKLDNLCKDCRFGYFSNL
jgi:hypothetical protein